MRQKAILVSSSLVFLLACERSIDESTVRHTLVLDSIVTLGYDVGPYSPTMKSEVGWLPGKYTLSHTHVPGEIAVLDENGRFLRSLGSKGGGPGEFRQIDGIATDTIQQHIHVLDTQNGRITTIDTAGAVITERRIHLFANQIEMLPKLEYVVHPLRDRSTGGLPAAIITADTVFELG